MVQDSSAPLQSDSKIGTSDAISSNGDDHHLPRRLLRQIQRELEHTSLRFLRPLISMNASTVRERLEAIALAERHANARRTCWLLGAVNPIPLEQITPQIIPVLRACHVSEDLLRVVESIIKHAAAHRLSLTQQMQGVLWAAMWHHLVARPFSTRLPKVPIIYAHDTLLLPCRDAGEAENVNDVLQGLLGDAQITSPEPFEIVTLTEELAVDWLGVRFRWDGEEVEMTIADYTWERLKRDIHEVSCDSHGRQVAKRLVAEFVVDVAAAIVHTDLDAAYRRIHRILKTRKMHDFISEASFTYICLAAHQSWRWFRRQYEAKQL